jgi:hypothetical protein
MFFDTSKFVVQPKQQYYKMFAKTKGKAILSDLLPIKIIMIHVFPNFLW